jgi:hypothetical protein
MRSVARAPNSQSCRGHSAIRTAALTTANATVAIESSAPARVLAKVPPPKKDAAMAAAAISVPARERSSLTARS